MSAMIQVEVLRAACCVAGANGETTEAERELLNKLAKKTGVGLASLEAMVSRACEDDSFCNEQFRVLKAEPKEAMSILLEVAMSDGVIDESEESILKVFAKKLDVPADVFELLLNKAKEIAAERK
jgi:tellurite resistance protein